MRTTSTLVQRLWNYCNVLRDDGLSYGDYVEQLTYLLFLKMAHERTAAAVQRAVALSRRASTGRRSDQHGRRRAGGPLPAPPGGARARSRACSGVIFRKAQNRIQDPAKLRRLIVDLIDRETWIGLDADVKGDAYEGLLEKNAAGHQVRRRPVLHAARR